MHVSKPQPAKGVLALRRISNRDVARELDLSEIWVGRVLNGHAPPPESFRKGLADLLWLPEEQLFRDGSEPVPS